jgi:hypothetical protein
MNVETRYHRAVDVMTMKKRGSMPGSLPFADSAFRATVSGAEFGGAGLYACFFRDQLIYVGKYLGRKNAWQEGNVVAMRWIKHIGTFTMRERQLGFSQAAYREIGALCGQGENKAEQAVWDGFRASDRSVLVRETGCMTTLRRFLVALRIRSETAGDPSLGEFCFVYTRATSDSSTSEQRKRVSEAEALILRSVHPEANTIANPSRPTRLGQEKVGQVFEKALGGQQAFLPTANTTDSLRTQKVQERMRVESESTGEPEDCGAEARFLEKIEKAPDAVLSFINLLTEHVAGTTACEVNYTYTPDLCIRSYGKQARQFRNVVTIEWKPKKKMLLMRSLLPESELKAYDLSQDHIGHKVLKNETFLTLDRLEKQSKQIVEAIVRAHELNSDCGSRERRAIRNSALPVPDPHAIARPQIGAVGTTAGIAERPPLARRRSSSGRDGRRRRWPDR